MLPRPSSKLAMGTVGDRAISAVNRINNCALLWEISLARFFEVVRSLQLFGSKKVDTHPPTHLHTSARTTHNAPPHTTHTTHNTTHNTHNTHKHNTTHHTTHHTRHHTTHTTTPSLPTITLFPLPASVSRTQKKEDHWRENVNRPQACGKFDPWIKTNVVRASICRCTQQACERPCPSTNTKSCNCGIAAVFSIAATENLQDHTTGTSATVSTNWGISMVF